MIVLKSKQEVEQMRVAGKLLASILERVSRKVKPGISLLELDRIAEELTLQAGAKPAFKGYLGFRHTLCLSVNEQVVHGIPTSRKLVEGDVVGIDYGLVLNGFYSDSAVTIPVGNISAEAKELLEVTKNSLYSGISSAVIGNTIKDISRSVEDEVKPFGYGVVKEFVGHGIGRKLHEDPQIPNYEKGASAIPLQEGMTLAIEPMINQGTSKVRVLEDGWTAVTTDGKLSAHFEHTIAIIGNGKPEILTEWSSGTLGVF